MSKSTISTFELFQMFPDQEIARVYFEAKRWPDGAICPACGEAKRIGTRKGGFYRCNACLLDFTVRTGTIFEKSKVPLNKWLAALYVLAQRPDTISETLANAVGVSQPTAAYLSRRVIEAAGDMFAAALFNQDDRRPVRRWNAYSVTADGRIWTRYKPGRGGRLGFEWRQISPTSDKNGYRVVRLYRDGGQWKQKRVCRLVCAAFHGPARGREVRHLDGDNKNDASANLIWGTSAENSADTFEHGTAPLGETHHNATLTDAQVAEIRSLKGKMLQREIAAQFGTTQGYVSELHSGSAR